MRRLAAAAAAVVLAGGAGLAAHAASRGHAQTAPACGKWRWLVKTLADAPAKNGEVSFSPHWSSVAKLAAMTAPDAPWTVAPTTVPHAFGRFGKIERQALLLPVRLVQAKREPDGDIHLIVSSPSDPATTLVVEFPNKACTDSSPKKDEMENARQKFITICDGVPSTVWKGLHGAPAYISGVPFFDFGHGEGHPQNGAEIHPALGFSAKSC